MYRRSFSLRCVWNAIQTAVCEAPALFRMQHSPRLPRSRFCVSLGASVRLDRTDEILSPRIEPRASGEQKKRAHLVATRQCMGESLSPRRCVCDAGKPRAERGAVRPSRRTAHHGAPEQRAREQRAGRKWQAWVCQPQRPGDESEHDLAPLMAATSWHG